MILQLSYNKFIIIEIRLNYTKEKKIVITGLENDENQYSTHPELNRSDAFRRRFAHGNVC